MLLLVCRPVADMAPSCACSEMSNWTGVTSLGSSSPFTGLTSLAHLWEFCVCWVFSLVFFHTYVWKLFCGCMVMECMSVKMSWAMWQHDFAWYVSTYIPDVKDWFDWGCITAVKSTIGTELERWTHLCCSLWPACKNCETWPCLMHASARLQTWSCSCSEMSNWTGVTSLESPSPFTSLTSLVKL